MKQFMLTSSHIELLRSMYVSWCYDEFGAPMIDPKRPYGNSNIIDDISNILGLKTEGCSSCGRKEQTVESGELQDLHYQTEHALQIVLATGQFEPGLYEADDYMRNWRKVGG